MSASAKLKFKIVKCTSEDVEYPVSELLSHVPGTKGWQTARYCDFPQEIGIQFETPVHLRQVQFLSHQSKISSKIELFTAMPREGQTGKYEGAEFKRLGYLLLDNNERSKFQARELKSVYVDVQAQFLRVLFGKCHTNKYNIVNQVGLIALNCLGEVLGPDLAVGPPPPNPTLARAPEPQAGPSRRSSPVENAQDAAQAASDESRYDARTLERLRALTAAKQRAVELEDYEEAKRCKEMLAQLRQTGLLLRELEDKKRAAVQKEDFDAAKALKVEIDRLRVAIERPQAPPEHDDGRSGNQMAGPRGAHQPVMAQAPMSVGNMETENVPSRVSSRGRLTPLSDTPAAYPWAPQESPQPGEAIHNDHQVFAGAPPRDEVASPAVPAHGKGPRVANSPIQGPRVANSPIPGPRVANSPIPGQRESLSSSPPPDHDSQEREPSSSFDSANHPLSGVPNIEDLGQPEPLKGDAVREAEPLVALFGEYITWCTYSKSWNLRDAAVQKLTLDLQDGVYSSKDKNQLLQGFVGILKRTIQDKNVQVFLSSAALLQAVFQHLLGRGRIGQAQVQAAMEPLLPLLVERLGDANQRVEKTTRDALFDFARSPNAGPSFTSQHLLKPPKKKTVHARVYSSRLQLLAALVTEFGVQPDSRDGIPLEGAMKLAMDWFSNASADVRESAVKLAGACYVKVGLNRIEQYLANLRDKQREVFDAEFERISNSGGDDDSAYGAPMSGRANAGRPLSNQRGTRDNGDGSNGDFPSPKVPPPRRSGAREAQAKTGGPVKGSVPYDAETEPDNEIDEYTCQFCRCHDPSFTEETLDLHYWRECPMLMPCQFCEQVVEISAFQAHIQDECENGASAGNSYLNMRPNQCPLCMTKLPGSHEDDWIEHLLTRGCPKNPRNRRSGH